jgi:hypothetical protein
MQGIQPSAALAVQSSQHDHPQFVTTAAAALLLLLPATSVRLAGIVQRRWVWLLLFSPLWGSLFINFGLGPIVSRTSDTLPIAANTAAFLLAALSPAVLQRLWNGPSDDAAAKPPMPPPMSQPPSTPPAAAPPAAPPAPEQPPATSTQD